MPGWLAAVQNSLPEDLRDPSLDDMVRARGGSVPPVTDSLAGEAKPDAEPSPPAQIEQDSNEWLSSILTSMRGDAPPAEESTEPAEPVEDAQGWLSSVLPTSDEAPVQSEGVPAPSPAEEPAEEPDEPLDWLSDLRNSVAEVASTTTSEPADGSEEYPDWLRAQLSGQASHTEPAPPESDFAMTQPIPRAEPPDATAREPESPEWLRSVQETIPSAFPEEPAGVPPYPEESQSGREIPEWLQDIHDTYSRPKETPSAEPPMPDWLRAYQDDEQPEQTHVPAAGQPVPDWLAGPAIEDPDTFADEPASHDADETLRFPTLEQPGDAESLPPEEEVVEPDADLDFARGWPDTGLLSRVFGDREPMRDETPSPTSESEPPEEPAGPSPSPSPTQPAERALGEGETLPMEAASLAWLLGDEGADVPPDEPTEEMPASSGELPDWLLQHSTSDSDQVADGWLAETGLAEAAEAEVTPDGSVADNGFGSADVPDWLASLTHEESAIETSGERSADGERAEIIFAQEELPDWLREAKGALSESAEPEEATREAPGTTADLDEQQATQLEPFAEEPGAPPQEADETTDGTADVVPEPETAQVDSETAGIAAPDMYADDSAASLEEWALDTEDISYEEAAVSGPEIRQEALFAPGGEDEPIPAAHVTPEAGHEDIDAMPQWLRDLRKQEKSEDLEPPAWLTDAASAPAEGAAEDTRAPDDASAADWLGTVKSSEEDIGAEGFPDWLREMDSSAERPTKATATPDEATIPSWLREMGDLAKSSVGADVNQAEPDLPAAEGDAGASAEPAVPASQSTLDETVVTPRVPGPAEAHIATPGSTAPMPATRPPARSRPEHGRSIPVLPAHAGTLGIENAVSAVRPGSQRPEHAGPEDTELSEVFREIVNEPLLSRVSQASEKRPRTWQALGRALIYLLVIAAVGVPLYWQGALGLSYVDEHNIPVSSQTRGVYERINAVPVRETALLIVDYEPSLAEELNVQARALLRAFMQRQFRILIVSTSLGGSQVAQDIVDELAAQSNGSYQYGRDYLNLGYLPGQETSLALFGRSPLSAVRVDFRDGKELASFVIARSLEAVPDEGFGQIVPLVVDLSGNQENLRTWIEQVAALNPDLSTIAGVSAGLEPYFVPYLKSGQLAGMLSGLVGAAELEALSERPARAIRSIDSQIAAHLLIVALILVGNLAYAFKRLTKRR